MKVIQLYQCEVCGKESRNESKIKNHEVQCKIQERKRVEREKNKAKWEKEFLETFHPSKLKECVNSYLDKFGVPPFEELHYELRYYDHVSNSHSAPINGETNWGRKKEGIPTGYPGFKGRVWGYDNSVGCSISEYCGAFYNKVKIPGLHTGSGGGSGEYRYEFQFFLDDFPSFKKEFEERQLKKVAKANLSGDYSQKIDESYSG